MAFEVNSSRPPSVSEARRVQPAAHGALLWMYQFQMKASMQLLIPDAEME